jgi:hypothetical protein
MAIQAEIINLSDTRSKVDVSFTDGVETRLIRAHVSDLVNNTELGVWELSEDELLDRFKKTTAPSDVVNNKNVVFDL